MNKTRCDWAGNNPLYVDYHDNEWGYPVKDDDKLFEFLILETFQAGLSWITILKKRENFREAFDHILKVLRILSCHNAKAFMTNSCSFES
jgi:DNA-3-methyladenine glycosylase I